MLVKHYFIIFFLLQSACFIYGQQNLCDHIIKGKILDAETKQPVPFASVKVKGLEKFAYSDADGNFMIGELCSKKNTLIISCLGYSSSTSEHHHEHDDGEFHFLLTQDLTGLDEVTIKAERRKEEGTETISQATLNKAEIRSIPTQSLAAAVSKIDGVTFASVGVNVQLPVIHGLTGNRILFLNNGLKHAFQNWGNQHAPEIDLNTINNITVIKGAAGVRYGPEALAGVVRVEPNSLLLNNPLYVNAGATFQSNGLGGNASFEIGKGSGNWSYFFNGSYTRLGDRTAPGANITDAEREDLGIIGDGPTDNRVNLTNTGKEEAAFGFGVLHHLNNWDFKLYYNFNKQNLGQLRGAFVATLEDFFRALESPVPLFVFPFSYEFNEPRQDLQHHTAKAEVDWNYADKGKLTFRFGAQLNLREEFDIRRNAQDPIIDLDLTTFDYQLEWKHSTWKGLDGFIGVQYFTQKNDNDEQRTNTTPFIPNYEVNRFSVFAIEKVKFGDDTLEAGIRFDIENNDVAGLIPGNVVFRDQYTFTNFTASLGYQWQLSDNSSFKTNIGSAFRTPNVAELFSFGVQGFTTTFGLLRFVNDNGRPDTSEVTLLDDSDVNLERGYKFTNEFRTSNNGNAHAITVYGHYIENFVFDRPFGLVGSFVGPQLGFFTDQADALFVGLDYTWKKEFNDKLSGTFGLSYLWSRNIGEDQPLPSQPPISTNIELKWDQGQFWIFESSNWTLRPSYTFRQFQAPRTINDEAGLAEVGIDSEIFDFADAPDGYFLLDASWNFKFNNSGIGGSIALQNLLNTSYRNVLNEFRYFADEPGRNILVGVNYNF